MSTVAGNAWLMLEFVIGGCLLSLASVTLIDCCVLTSSSLHVTYFILVTPCGILRPQSCEFVCLFKL